MLVIIPTVVVGVLVYVNSNYLKGVQQSSRQMTEVRVPSIKGLDIMNNARLKMRLTFWEALNSSSKMSNDSIDEKVGEILKSYHEGWAIYEPLEQTAEEEKLWKEFIPPAKAWEENVKKLLSSIKDGELNEAKSIFSGALKQSFGDSQKLLEAIVDINFNVVEKEKKSLDEAIASSIKSSLIFGLLGVLTTVLFGLFLGGNLSKALTQVAERLSGAGAQVSSASEQLSAASQQLSSGATESASALEETVSSLEELSSMVKLNADNAREASHLSLSSRKSAEDGENEIRSLIGAMTDISRSSKKIEEIINVIDDIAFQTNLLALNAAVEAARAGEQGKGFAVVAEAVRNLAQRSASAAKDITVLIKESVDQITNGSKIADQSGEVLKNIVSSVKKVSDLNNEIASASSEQSKGISQISKAMNELDQSTQRNAASAEETATSSEEMSAQASELQGLVGELTTIIEGTSGDINNNLPHQGYSSRQGNVIQLKHKRKHIGKPTLAASIRSSQNVDANRVIPFDEDQDDKSSSGGKIGDTVGF